MRYLTSLFSIVIVAAGAFGVAAVAQTPAAAPSLPPAYPVLAPPTIGVVDIQRVLQESSAGRSIQSQLESERRKIRDQASRLDEELKSGENELRRQRAVMAPEQVNEQVQVLQRKQADAQRILQERQEAFTKGENEAVNVVGDNMRDIVQQYASERHIGMVLRKELVISMADKNTDITDEVIQRLNAKLPSVTVTVAPPSAVQADSQPAPSAPPAKSSKK
jgi:Skp family chaperone for outer membrane proteins